MKYSNSRVSCLHTAKLNEETQIDKCYSFLALNVCLYDNEVIIYI